MNTADISLTFGELFSMIGLFLSVVAFVTTIVWNLWKRVIQNGRDLTEYKLEVAEKYVQSTQLNEMEKKMLLSEERLHGSIGNLTARIDRILDRMERS